MCLLCTEYYQNIVAGIRLDDLPDFAASLLFEVYFNPDVAYHENPYCVQLWYKNRDTVEPMILSGCNSGHESLYKNSFCCPIERFARHLQKVATHNYEKDCRI